MTATLTRRITKLESRTLPPGLQEMATRVAREHGLDPHAVIQQCHVILRQIEAAGIPLTHEAIAAFLDSPASGETPDA